MNALSSAITASSPSRSPLKLSIFCTCVLMGALWLVLPHPILIVIVCALPLAVLFVLANTFFLVLLFVIFSFFRIHEVIPILYPFKIPLLLSLGCLFSLFWHVGISQKLKVYWHKDLTIAACFFALVTIGVVAASNIGIAMAYYKGVYWKIFLMMLAIAWLTRDYKAFSTCSIFVVVFGSLVAIVAISNKINGIGLVEETRVTIGREIGSVLGDPNDLALVLMFPFAFACGLAMTKGLKKWFWLAGFISTPIFFFAVLATQSRGGLLGVLTVLGVFGYRKIRSKTLLVGLGVGAAMLLFVFAGISDRKSGGAAEEGIDASAQGRLYAWEAAAKMAVDNPITGVGIDNFYSNYYFYSSHWDGLNHAVHSTWFGVLAETGFVGLFVFIYLIIRLLIACCRNLKAILQCSKWRSPYERAIMTASAESLLAGLAATAVSGTFLTQGFTWPIYIQTGLIVALSTWTQKHCQERQNA